MSLHPTFVRVPGTGELSLAPPGTPEPPDSTTTLPAAWVGLGLFTEDGVTIKRTIEKSGTTHWQQITPARYIYTSQELTVASVFQESKVAVLGVYFGGMTFAEVGTGSKKYRAEISAVPKGDERALCVDWTDQISATEVYHHRLYVPRVEVSETADAQWTRTQEARWGLTFAALSPASGATLTADPVFVIGAFVVAFTFIMQRSLIGCGLGYLGGAAQQALFHGWVWRDVRNAGREGCVWGMLGGFRGWVKRW